MLLYLKYFNSLISNFLKTIPKRTFSLKSQRSSIFIYNLRFFRASLNGLLSISSFYLYIFSFPYVTLYHSFYLSFFCPFVIEFLYGHIHIYKQLLFLYRIRSFFLTIRATCIGLSLNIFLSFTFWILTYKHLSILVLTLIINLPHVGHSVVVKLSCLYFCSLLLILFTTLNVKFFISCMNF